MGSSFKDGKKPSNRVTISRGGDVAARKLNPDTHEVDRSFAQPNPAVPHPEVEPKVHASAEQEVEALNKNSVKGRKYTENKVKNEDSE